MVLSVLLSALAAAIVPKGTEVIIATINVQIVKEIVGSIR
jgi:hypothetical protein